MRAIRIVGNALLWAAAVLGVLSGALWIAHGLGLVQPLVVVSGSMQPAIRTGDLIIATSTDVDDLHVGDVASLRSAHGDGLVTHRVIEIVPQGDTVELRMQGDANDVPDAETYAVGANERVLTPVLTVPGGGHVVQTLTRPGVAIPLVVSIAALILLAAIPPSRARRGETAMADAADPAAARSDAAGDHAGVDAADHGAGTCADGRERVA